MDRASERLKRIVVELDEGPLVSERSVEIVERKGAGHPDSVCDGIMEEVSIGLSKEYRKRFGAILHHNCDKGLLVAGRVERRFGGGRVIEPMRLVMGDRALWQADGKGIDVEAVAVAAARRWIRKHLRFVDPEKDIDYQVELRPGSEELTGLFKSEAAVLGANDTSAVVGYAPLTDTEKVVLEVERQLNGKSFKEAFPETGEDVKVMGSRIGKDLSLTIAMPLIDRFIDRESIYFKRKGEILDSVHDFVKERRGGLERVRVEMNALDARGRGMAGMYLSVLGTSAEDADSGQVGRGNMVNGLIALHRPRGAEAAAGKNPVSHVGKIYNVLSDRIANDIYQQIKGVREATVWLCSQIGTPVNRPTVSAVRVAVKKGFSFDAIAGQVRVLVDAALDDIPRFCDGLSRGKYPVF